MFRLRTVKKAVIALVGAAVVLSGMVGVTPAEASSCQKVALKSVANGKYVSTELHYWGDGYAMLRARADRVGDWEQFTRCDDGWGNISLQSVANGLFVTAELGYSGGDYGMLRASRSWVGSWEKFRLVPGVSGGSALRSVGNGSFVAAELSYWWANYAMLRARSNSVSAAESFVIERLY